MSRFITILVAAFLAVFSFSAKGVAQDFTALARVQQEESRLSNGWRGSVLLELGLSQGVPWRVFQLDDPKRMVLDFREVDWRGFDVDAFGAADGVAAVRVGQFRPGWSRMVVDLSLPLVVDEASLTLDTETGAGQLRIVLEKQDDAAFAARAGAPRDPRWDLPEPVTFETEPDAEKPDWAPVLIVLDPGHGGIDPGAERSGVSEKDLMLTFGRELRESLRRAGFEVHMTRDEDVFVSLERRVSIAHEAKADLFISLHADALQKGHATGATVYTLSEEASDAASATLAERHDRADILAGIDLSSADDQVADILLDLARLETQPRSEHLATQLVRSIKGATGAINKKPHRKAGFSVLKAADVPSILIEVGFLSSDEDLKRLKDVNWRAVMAGAIRDGVQAWVDEDKALRDLVRQ